jgi:hypothetical protein
VAVVNAQRALGPPVGVIRWRVTVSFGGMRCRAPDCELLWCGRWDSTMHSHCVVTVHIDDDMLTGHGLYTPAPPPA